MTEPVLARGSSRSAIKTREPRPRVSETAVERASPKCGDFRYRSAAKLLAGPATRPCDTHQDRQIEMPPDVE